MIDLGNSYRKLIYLNNEGVATTSTAPDNTNTTQLATTAFAKSQDAVLARLPDQAVNMTSATSGSSGITVADNNNIDFGTGNFTLVWRGSLPDWTPSSAVWLMMKLYDSNNYWEFAIINTSGTFYFGTRISNSVNYDLSITPSIQLLNNTNNEVVLSVVRETLTSSGSLKLYINGLFAGTTSITAAATQVLSNSGILYISGSHTIRNAGTCSFAATFNRALSAAEVLDLYRTGISYSDKWGSQTNLITGSDSTFAGASNWVNWSFDGYDETTGGVLTLTKTSDESNSTARLSVVNAPMTVGKKYRLSFDVTIISGSVVWNIWDYTGFQGFIGNMTSGHQSIEFVAEYTGGVMIEAIRASGAASFDNFELYEIGATLALEPEGIQSDKWYDSSSNALNASYPAAGWSLTRSQNGIIPFVDSRVALTSRLPDQAVNMTAASSGSNGIVVADNDNIDFGTGNFTLVWRGSLPDWTPSDYVSFFVKISASLNISFQIHDASTGKIDLYLAGAGGLIKNYSSTNSSSFQDGTSHELTAVVIRETTLVAGSVSIYIDGVLFESSVIAAGTGGSLSSSANLYVLGASNIRFAGTCSFAATFNRALTAAEVLDLYRNGISFADKWGSQTNLITGNDSTFAGTNNWVNGSFNSFDKTTDLSITATAIAQFCRLPIANLPVTGGKRYILSFNAANTVGTFTFLDFNLATYMQPSATAITPVSGVNSLEFVTSPNVSGGLCIYASSNNSSGDFDNFSLVEIGATLALEPEGIQNDKWYDSSTNALNASYPAAGWSLARKLNVPRVNTAQPAFLAFKSSVSNDVTGDGTFYSVVCNSEVFDQSNSFSTSTGVFTAPITGKYVFSMTVLLQQVTSAHATIEFILATSNRAYNKLEYNSATLDQSINASFIVDMDAGDTAYPAIVVSGGTKVVDVSGHATNAYTSFSGHLVC